GLEDALVLRDLLEARIRRPLADLVAHDRYLVTRDVLAVVAGRLRRVVQLACALHARLDRHVVLVLRDHGPARAGRVTPSRVARGPVLDPIAQEAIAVPAAGLVG